MRSSAPEHRSGGIGLQCDLDTADETCHRVGQLGFGASPEVTGGVDLQKRAAGVGGSSRRGVGEDRGNRGANISAARAVEKS